MSTKKVFLSSTGRDLAEYREAAYKAIEGLDGFHCVRMEDFGARDWESDSFCKEKVAECNVYVGIIGHVFGSSPKGSEKSYTEREYDVAIDSKKPRLMFLAPESFQISANLVESDDKRKKQKAFRDRVSSDRIRKTFNSPGDLGQLVTQAIHNLEQEQSAEPQVHSENKPQLSMPLPPLPNFVHPYPLQANFTGRIPERQMLTNWLTNGNQPLFALIAMGGMGKSALTWAWVRRDLLGLTLPGSSEKDDADNSCIVPEADRPEGVLWWSFYERDAKFHAFLNESLIYASEGSINPANVPSVHDKVKTLITLLQKRRILLVLDGFERELRGYSNLSASYQGDAVLEDEHGDFRTSTDINAAEFLRSASSVPLKSRILLISRHLPRELDDLAGCRREDLSALHPDDAVAFFYSQGVQGTRAEIQEACQPYGYHALALRLLAGVIINDKKTPSDVQVAKRYPVLDELKGKERHHILQVAYDVMEEPNRTLLSCIAAFRSPMSYDAVRIYNTSKEEFQFDAALNELIQRDLLLFDREQVFYDMHPVVRQYAYDRLTDKKGVHTRLIDYFSSLPIPEDAANMSLADMSPVIELYHHVVRAGRFDAAWNLFNDRLGVRLFSRFASYQTCIELLSALFPTGEQRDPKVSEVGSSGSIMNSLALSYDLSGQPLRALHLYGRALTIAEYVGNYQWEESVLVNLAGVYYQLGEFSVAESMLRRSISQWDEVEDGALNSGRIDLSLLLASQGDFAESQHEFEIAFAAIKKMRNLQWQCVHWQMRAESALMMKDASVALKAARQAKKLAESYSSLEFPVERDFVISDWLIGASLISKTLKGSKSQHKILKEAESHLTEALTRCRRINLINDEPKILLSWAKCAGAKGNTHEARISADEALRIADRCKYRLDQADIHNFLAQLAVDAKNTDLARKHARIARERAWCDGPPHCYKPALGEAERLLQKLNRLK
jgi:tetratricopeptide (TPR) repeat protein